MLDTWTRRTLFFGDSFVAGVGDGAGLGWVGRLVAASFAAGTGLTPYNLGVRLETSEDVAARWHDEARPRLLAGTEPRLVLSFGANDTTATDGGTRVTASRTVRALASILDRAAEDGLPAFFVGPPLAGDDAQHDRIRELSPLLARACADRGVPFAEVAAHQTRDSTWVREARDGDGAHPGAAGYEELSRLLLRVGCLEWLR